VGAGGILVEIVRLVDPANVVCGIDVSPKMLAKARRHVAGAGHANLDLREADARSLPFPDKAFDVLFNSLRSSPQESRNTKEVSCAV